MPKYVLLIETSAMMATVWKHVRKATQNLIRYHHHDLDHHDDHQDLDHHDDHHDLDHHDDHQDHHHHIDNL